MTRVTKPWTDADLERAKKLYAIGYSPRMIANDLGRGRDAVYSKLRNLGVTKIHWRQGRRVSKPAARRHVLPEPQRDPWHPARDPIPARYDWFYGFVPAGETRQEQTAV